MMKKLTLCLGLFLTLLLFVGCNVVSVTGITITSENNVRTIKVEETLQLTATVYPAGADQTVIWTSSSEAATVNETGLVTGVSVGNVKIKATSKVNESVSQEFALVIEEKEYVVVNPVSVSVEADKTSCKVGETINLTAKVLPVEASQSVVWSSSDETVATVSRGQVTPKKEGSVTITVAAKDNAEIKSTISLSFEKADDPVVSKDWANMPYSSHDDVINAEKDVPVKVKGVVTHISASKNGINYFLQNGTQGFYVYDQDNTTFPVELGKVYEVGGFKKLYNGLHEIVNVELCNELSENITYTPNTLSNVNTADAEAMLPYQSSIVAGAATITSVSVNSSKAYNVTAKIGEYTATFRVDPAFTGQEEFAKINALLNTAVGGTEFEFKGFMSAYGYGKATPQIYIMSSEDLELGEVSVYDVLVGVAGNIEVAGLIGYTKTEIELVSSIEGMSDITVTWTSDNAAINVSTGVVTHGTENVVVTLTLTLAKEGVTFEKEFKVTVQAIDNTVYEVVATLNCEDASTENSWGNSVTKGSYTMTEINDTVKLGGHSWMLKNSLISSTSSDKFEGIYGIRAQAGKTAEETARIEIKEDVECNAVKFDAAVYGNDPVGVKIKVEYSTDSGKTWISTEIITLNNTSLENFKIKLPETANRVAIVVIENTGKRVGFDNINLLK